ncbi:MAG: hypothetical protein LBM60_07725 [Clostridium sp.]|jgi:Tfp pilus assembly pilus retraction ATPase PilT|nr:hypothetical protein [Clostridium sp.]
MKSEEVRVYREIQRNTQMAMKAIDAISDKVHNEELSDHIHQQSLLYSKIHNEALENLLHSKARPYQGSRIEDLMLKGGIRYNTMLNTSTSHMAEMMMKGSQSGIIDMNKVLNRTENAGTRSTSLAQQLIDCEQKSIDTLKKYL